MRAGLTDILIVTGRGKVAIEDHFDRSLELEAFLEEKGKFDELKQIRELVGHGHDPHRCASARPLGLGHAVAVAEAHVGRRAVRGAARRRPDPPVGAAAAPRCSASHERYGRSVHRRPGGADASEISAYGVHHPRADRGEPRQRVRSIVEKPPADEAPSNLAAIGRYVFTPEIFDALRETKPGHGGEIQLTDAINLLAQEQAVYAFTFEQGRYDVGNKLDYLKATVELAIEREDVGPEFRDWLADFVQRKKLV